MEKMERNNPERIIEVLEEYVSAHKQQLVNEVLSKRTRHVTLAFEDIDKPHNISAVIRTAECMGIQDIHFIKNRNDYSVNPTITQGSAKWLSFHHYNQDGNNVDACYSHLRSEGYTIYATSLNERSLSIDELDPTTKTAIVFGTEGTGISEEAGEKADGYVHIPMAGFTESFNLSVSAALCLSTLSHKTGKAFPAITNEEKQQLKADWYRKIVREADLILKNQGVEV